MNGVFKALETPKPGNMKVTATMLKVSRRENNTQLRITTNVTVALEFFQACDLYNLLTSSL
jgi:hypothetical protein